MRTGLNGLIDPLLNKAYDQERSGLSLQGTRSHYYDLVIISSPIDQVRRVYHIH